MEVDEITGIVGDALTSKLDLSKDGYSVRALDTGEVFIRAPDGSIFKLEVTEIEDDEAENTGVDFDD